MGEESDSEFMVVVARSCRAVERAVENYDEEKSPTSLDSLLFCTNELYRLLMATSGEQNQDLEEVGRGIGLLNEIEERTGEPDITGYTANPTPSYQSRGRPKFDIHKEKIEHLLNLNFTCPKIADLLGVSLRTIRRRMDEYGLSVSHFYSSISEHELLRVMKDIYSSFPNCGYRMMDGHLRRRGIRVSQARIRSSIHCVDPEGVALRWRQAIKCRQYRVAGPLALWHIDGNHKLIR